MPYIKLNIEQLVLDNDNPRTTRSDGQQQALQKVIKDQKTKLVRLAESIVEHGLSPIERFMVLEVSAKPRRYIALEGNRRVTALRLLTNPAAMTGLDMPKGMQKSMEHLASIFDKSNVEPVDAYEVGSREDARYWIDLRHNGEDKGRGLVVWKTNVAARYRKQEPATQAFDAVMEHGGFSEDVAEDIRSGFPLTTLRRLMESKDVRAEIGLSVQKGQLCTKLPGGELIKPLKKIILDIAGKKVTSRDFNTTDRMLEYVRGFKKADKPDLNEEVAERPVEGIQKAEFKRSAKKAKKIRKLDPSDRKEIVPKNCDLDVADNRISEIYKELRTLKLIDAPNAIAVLLRVFLELSVDHFLNDNEVSLKFQRSGGRQGYKPLDKKLAEVVNMLVDKGVPQERFKAVTRSLSVKTSPLYVDLLHCYVHDPFTTPAAPDLKAAWDIAQRPLFEKIWPR